MTPLRHIRIDIELDGELISREEAIPVDDGWIFVRYEGDDPTREAPLLAVAAGRHFSETGTG